MVTMIVAFAYQMTTITPGMRQMRHRLLSKGEASVTAVGRQGGHIAATRPRACPFRAENPAIPFMIAQCRLASGGPWARQPFRLPGLSSVPAAQVHDLIMKLVRITVPDSQ